MPVYIASRLVGTPCNESTNDTEMKTEEFVFICYAHADRDVVMPEIMALQNAGFTLWYDEGIRPGSEWNAAIADAIQKCETFLYLVTPASVASEHCRRELNFALEEKRSVLAMHLEPTDVPAALRLSLSHRQAIMQYRDARYFDKLCAALEGRESVGSAAESLTLADFVLDPASRTLKGGGATTTLDPKETAVLSHLIDGYPNVVSTEDLLSRSWPGVVVGDNALQQVIARLRKAFGDDARAPRFIETVPRTGYRLLVRAEPVLNSLAASQKRSPNVVWVLAAAAVLVISTAMYFLQGAGQRVTYVDSERIERVAIFDLIDLDADADLGLLAQGIARELRRQVDSLDRYESVPQVLLSETPNIAICGRRRSGRRR